MASYDEAIPPGQVGKVQAAVKTANLRGSIIKGIAITTNDPENPSVSVTVRADVVGSVTLLPRAVLFLNLSSGDETTARLLVGKDPTEEGALSISDLEVGLPWLEAKARRVVEQEIADDLPPASPGDWIIELGLRGEAEGSDATRLSFRTGLPREPVVEVPVRVLVPRTVLFNNRELVLLSSDETPGVAEGIVYGRLRAGAEVSGVTVVPPVFQATLEEAAPGNVKVRVRWNGSAPDSPTAGTLTLQAGSEEFPLPVRVAPVAATGQR